MLQPVPAVADSLLSKARSRPRVKTTRRACELTTQETELLRAYVAGEINLQDVAYAVAPGHLSTNTTVRAYSWLIPRMARALRDVWGME